MSQEGTDVTQTLQSLSILNHLILDLMCRNNTKSRRITIFEEVDRSHVRSETSLVKHNVSQPSRSQDASFLLKTLRVTNTYLSEMGKSVESPADESDSVNDH